MLGKRAYCELDDSEDSKDYWTDLAYKMRKCNLYKRKYRTLAREVRYMMIGTNYGVKYDEEIEGSDKD